MRAFLCLVLTDAQRKFKWKKQISYKRRVKLKFDEESNTIRWRVKIWYSNEDSVFNELWGWNEDKLNQWNWMIQMESRFNSQDLDLITNIFSN